MAATIDLIDEVKIRVHSCTRYAKIPDYLSVNGRHPCHHFYYLRRGQYRAKMNGTVFDIPENSLLSIPSEMPHSLTIVSGSPELSVIEVDMLLFGTVPYLNTVVSLPTIIPARGWHRPQQVFVDMATSYILRRDGWQKQLDQDALAFLGALLGHCATTEEGRSLSQRQSEKWRRLKPFCQLIAVGYRGEITLSALAETLATSPSQARRITSEMLGEAPIEHLRGYRLRRVCKRLIYHDEAPAKIAQDVGLGSRSHFFRLFKQYYGLSPSAYREQHSRQSLGNSSTEPQQKDLRGTSLARLNFSSLSLTDTNLSRADLLLANFGRADLSRCIFRDAYAYRSDLQHAIIENADFENADFERSYMIATCLRHSRMRNIRLALANLFRADLSYTDLTSADFYRASLHEAYLEGACLAHANFAQASLCRAHIPLIWRDLLSQQHVEGFPDIRWIAYDATALEKLRAGADAWNHYRRETSESQSFTFTGLKFKGLDLSGADLHGIDFRFSEFDQVILDKANLDGANLQQCSLQGSANEAIFTHCDLRHTRLQLSCQKANFSHTNLDNTKLQNASFQACLLVAARFQDAHCAAVDFRGAQLDKANLARTTFLDVNLTKASLRECNLTDIHIHTRWREFITQSQAVNKDFVRWIRYTEEHYLWLTQQSHGIPPGKRSSKPDGAFRLVGARLSQLTHHDLHLHHACLDECFIEDCSFLRLQAPDLYGKNTSILNTVFNYARLERARLTHSELSDTSWYRSELPEACFDDSQWTSCNLSSSDCTKVSFRRSILSNMNFRGSIVVGATFERSQLISCRFDGANLEQVRFRNATFHDCFIDRCWQTLLLEQKVDTSGVTWL